MTSTCLNYAKTIFFPISFPWDVAIRFYSEAITNVMFAFVFNSSLRFVTNVCITFFYCKMEETFIKDLIPTAIFSTNIERQKNTVSSECKICGAPARYSYYGAIVCHSCKMFFKRNAENGQVN